MAKTEYKRLTLDLPPELHRELKQVALDQDTTVLALIMDCAEKHIVRTTYQRTSTAAAGTLAESDKSP